MADDDPQELSDLLGDDANDLAAEVATVSEGRLDNDSTKHHDVELTLREIRAVQLRAAGADYNEIARALNYSNRSGAFKAVRRALQRWGSEAVEELRILELQRLDTITKKLWPAIVGRTARDLGDGVTEPAVEPSREAMNLYLKVSQRRAKLLGLDAPTMLDLTGPESETAGDRTVADVERFQHLIAAMMAEEQGDDDPDEKPAEDGSSGNGTAAVADPVLPARAE